MKYNIQEEPKVKKYYYTVSDVIYAISPIEKTCGHKANLDSESSGVFITLKYKEKNGDINTRHVNLEDYIKCGDKIEGNQIKITDCDGDVIDKSLADIIKDEQKSELVQKILNGSNIKFVYDALPDFFRWNGSDIESGGLVLIDVNPNVYIDKLYTEDEKGNIKPTQDVIDMFIEEAKKAAKEEANLILKEIDQQVDTLSLTTKKL